MSNAAIYKFSDKFGAFVIERGESVQVIKEGLYWVKIRVFGKLEWVEAKTYSYQFGPTYLKAHGRPVAENVPIRQTPHRDEKEKR